MAVPAATEVNTHAAEVATEAGVQPTLAPFEGTPIVVVCAAADAPASQSVASRVAARAVCRMRFAPNEWWVDREPRVTHGGSERAAARGPGRGA